MTEDAYRSLREELPAHGDWVRRLARSLVRDEASADDLAQEANLAALRHPDSVRGALGPWLARVTRNFARRDWRTAARRASREQAVARPEAAPGADETTARVELQRGLVEELAVLAPPVRHAIVRRYFDGWSAARIARETGEPASTVRWRLQRGLAEMRARLDRAHGGDGIEWRLALLPVCGKFTPWSAVAGAGTIQGALTMNAVTQAFAALAAVSMVGFGVWWGVREEPRAAEAARVEAPLVAAAAVIVPTTEPAMRDSVGTRETVAATPAPPSSAPSTSEALRAETRVEGRCVDERLAAARDARVTTVGGSSPASADARVDGVFSLAVAPDGLDECTLRFDAPGLATRFLRVRLLSSQTTALGDVVLESGGRVRGRVLGPDGIPFSGAQITITSPDLPGSLEEARVSGPQHGPLHVEGVSDADGRFAVDGVAVGLRRVWAGAPELRYAVSPPIDVRAGASGGDEIELRLEPLQRDDRITGVLLAPSGEPLPDMSIGGFDDGPSIGRSMSVRTGPGGRFEIAAQASHVYDLVVRDGADRWSPLARRRVLPGTHELELRFQEPRWIVVRARSTDGTPVEDFEVTAEQPDESAELERTQPELHAGGVARLRVATEPFLVRVDARGFALAEQGPIAPEAAPDVLDFELVAQPGVHGRALMNGAPLAGAEVTLHAAWPGARIECSGLLQRTDPRACDRSTTDAEGRFHLRLRESNAYVVRAEAQGFAPSDAGPMDLDPAIGRDDVELVLGRGGALEGRVLVAAGLDPAGTIVALNRGDGFPRTVRAGADGTYHFEGLTPGPWHLTRNDQEVDTRFGSASYGGEERTELSFNCTVREGETTRKDLDLRQDEPCELDGVLIVNGAPAAGWIVRAARPDASLFSAPSTATAADGSFRVTVDEDGPVLLAFGPPAELGGRGDVQWRTELHPGKNEWREDFAMGRLTGRCLAPLTPGVTMLTYGSGPDAQPECSFPILPDADGRFELPFVPAGPGVVRRYDRETGWSTLFETVVPAGGVRVIDIH